MKQNYKSIDMIVIRYIPIYLAIISFTCVCGNYYTPNFGDPMQNVSAERGQDVSFTCSIEHLGKNKVAFLKVDPPTLLTWQHKTFATKPHKYVLENRKDVTHDHWILVINNVQESDSGAYMCQVGTSPMMSQTAYLILKVPPSINADKSTRKDVIATENQNVTMYCSADGSPSPSIYWKRLDDAVIITNDPMDGFGEAIIYKANLSIYKINRNHMADYVCLADNGVLPSESWAVKLLVNFPPTVQAVEQKVWSYASNDVELKCRAESWPRPQFRWLHKGQFILTNNTKYQQITGVPETPNNSPYVYESLSALAIRHLTDDDFGAYFCIAKNELGENKAAVDLIKLETLKETNFHGKSDNVVVPKVGDNVKSGRMNDENLKFPEQSTKVNDNVHPVKDNKQTKSRTGSCSTFQKISLSSYIVLFLISRLLISK